MESLRPIFSKWIDSPVVPGSWAILGKSVPLEKNKSNSNVEIQLSLMKHIVKLYAVRPQRIYANEAYSEDLFSISFTNVTDLHPLN